MFFRDRRVSGTTNELPMVRKRVRTGRLAATGSLTNREILDGFIGMLLIGDSLYKNSDRDRNGPHRSHERTVRTWGHYARNRA